MAAQSLLGSAVLNFTCNKNTQVDRKVNVSVVFFFSFFFLSVHLRIPIAICRNDFVTEQLQSCNGVASEEISYENSISEISLTQRSDLFRAQKPSLQLVS